MGAYLVVAVRLFARKNSPLADKTPINISIPDLINTRWLGTNTDLKLSSNDSASKSYRSRNRVKKHPLSSNRNHMVNKYGWENDTSRHTYKYIFKTISNISCDSAFKMIVAKVTSGFYREKNVRRKRIRVGKSR